MDRQIDFRALLLKIQDRLSSDDRRRLHFVIGDIIPRIHRDDNTLGGTLTVFESLFDRAVITEDYLDFLIRVFREIQCYDAVQRLEEYQLSKQPPKERKLTFTDVVYEDNEEDKYPTAAYEPLLSCDSSSISLYKPDVRKRTITETSSIQSIAETSPIKRITETSSIQPIAETPPIKTITETSSIQPIAVKPKQTQKTLFKSRLIFCLYILFLSQILLLLIYLWIVFRRKPSVHIIEHAYILKNGTLPENLGGEWFNHAENLSLTYADRLTRIDAYSHHDELYSIKFIYSQNKSIKHTLRNITRLNQPVLSSLDFQNQDIEQITQCYKINHGFKRLVGLLFGLKNQSTKLFGSCHEQDPITDVYSYHLFGYALGKTSQYLNGFQFFRYKICSLYNEVTSCVEKDRYDLLPSSFYKD